MADLLLICVSHLSTGREAFITDQSECYIQYSFHLKCSTWLLQLNSVAKWSLSNCFQITHQYLICWHISSYITYSLYSISGVWYLFNLKTYDDIVLRSLLLHVCIIQLSMWVWTDIKCRDIWLVCRLACHMFVCRLGCPLNGVSYGWKPGLKNKGGWSLTGDRHWRECEMVTKPENLGWKQREDGVWQTGTGGNVRW